MKYKNGKIVYEVGDWVTCFELSGYTDIDYAYPVGVAVQIKEFTVGECFRSTHTPKEPKLSRFRPASQREIDLALKEDKIMIGEYEVEFLKDKIKVGCVTVDRETYEKIGRKAGWLS